MSEIKIGIQSDGIGNPVLKSGQLAGISGIYFREKRLFPQESSFVDLYHLNKSNSEALDNHVDFIAELSSFSALPPNITTGPPYIENSCFLVSEKNTRMYEKIQKFQSSFEAIDTDAAVILGITSILLCIMLKKFSKSSSYSTNVLNIFRILIQSDAKSRPERISSRSLLFTILIWTFLIKTIYLGFIQLGFVMIEEGQNIESFSDMMERNLSLGSSNHYGFCRTGLESILHNSPKVNRTFQSIRRVKVELEGMSYSAEGVSSNVAFIVGKRASESVIVNRCFRHKKHKNSIHRSKPFFSQLLMLFHRNNLSKMKQKRLKTWSYAHFEFGFASIDHKHTRKMFEMKYVLEGRKLPDTSCLESYTKTIPFSQLETAFFSECFLFLLVLIIFSMTVFIIEINRRKHRVSCQ